MKKAGVMKIVLVSLLFSLIVPGVPGAELITRLSSREKVVALTMDACETKSPSLLDESIVSFILGEKIPCSIFVSGKFAVRNRQRISELSKLGFIRIENHSLSHFQHMERLDHEQVAGEVLENEALIEEMTGRKPRYFRFPAGNYNQETLRTVESLGYKVVHWTFPSGDPAKETTARGLTRWVLSRTGPGSILIFHVNGRGYHTGEALPGIVHEMKRRGYRFVGLEEHL